MRCFIIFFLFCLVKQNVSALEIDPHISAGGRYSDNPQQSTTATQGQWINEIEVVSTAQQKSQQIDAQAQGQMTVENSRVNAQLQSDIDWHLKPQQLDWLFRNVLQQIRQDVRKTAQRDNRQPVHQFSTGPVVRAFLSPIDQLTWQTLYSQTTGEQQQSHGYDSQLLWQHLLSPVYTFNSQLIGFKQKDTQQRRGYKASVGLAGQLRDSHWQVDVGWNALHQSTQAEQTGFLWRLGYDYQIDRQQSLIFSLGDALSDTRHRSLANDPTTSTLQTRGGVVRYQRQMARGLFSVGYSQELTRLSQQLSQLNPYINEDFSQDDDLVLEQFSLQYSQGQPNLWQWQVDAGYHHYDYQQLGRDNGVWHVAISSRYPILPRLSLGIETQMQWLASDLLSDERYGHWGIISHYALSRNWLLKSGFRQHRKLNQTTQQRAIENEVFMAIEY
jgi:hypothetical protein